MALLKKNCLLELKNKRFNSNSMFSVCLTFLIMYLMMSDLEMRSTLKIDAYF